MKKVTAGSSDYLVYFCYSLHASPNGRLRHKTFLKVGPGAGLLPRHVWRLQNASSPVRIPLKMVPQVPSDKPPSRITAWVGAALWGLRRVGLVTWILGFPGTLIRQPRPIKTQPPKLVGIFSPPHHCVQHIYEEWHILIKVHRFGI